MEAGLEEITRFRSEARRYPLGELPSFSMDPKSSKGMIQALDWLDVERSPRYRSLPDATFCNVYAYDVCYLRGVYLPRVWWKQRSIEEIQRGRELAVDPETVEEMTANDLFDWLNIWGRDFEWNAAESLSKAQDAANLGAIVLIVAKATQPLPGHISVVIPEELERPAVSGREEFFPAQSHAGRVNFRYFIGNWWKKAEYSDWSIWINSPAGSR